MVVVPNGVTVNVSYESSRSQKWITCFRCGEYGHYRGECYTFKTQLCKDFKAGVCANSDEACLFAHGARDLRQPWLPKCVRVVKEGGRVDVLGCGQMHMFRACPYLKSEVCVAVKRPADGGGP